MNGPFKDEGGNLKRNMMQDMQSKTQQGQYTADTRQATSAHWVVDKEEVCHRQKSDDRWLLKPETLVTEEIMGLITGRNSIGKICVISAQRLRHRAPAPSNLVAFRVTRDGLDDDKWENAEVGTPTRQSRSSSSSTTRGRNLRKHDAR
eukprot:1329643-Heterocapsa_arctica.AAC.1